MGDEGEGIRTQARTRPRSLQVDALPRRAKQETVPMTYGQIQKAFSEGAIDARQAAELTTKNIRVERRVDVIVYAALAAAWVLAIAWLAGWL